MKGIIIYEDYRGKKVVEAIKLGEVVYNCKIGSSDDVWTNELSGIRKESTQAYCNESDTYDFEIGALIALMKMCGSDKVVRACNEAFSYETDIKVLRKDNNNLREANKGLQEEVKRLKGEGENRWKKYQRNIQKKQDRINELERAYKDSNDDKAKLVEYYQREIKKLEAENEKLKLDCEKLQHGYNDMIFCGGRQNGKQYTFLVDLFKKIDQKKVDAAYKEAYNTALPVWQKEVLKQMYGVYKESKEKTEFPRTLDINGTVYRKSIQIKDFSNDQLDSLIEGSRAFTRKFDSEWLKLCKRVEMWEKIFELHKESDVIIKVKREDVNTFLHELENKIPEITWASCVKIFETKYTIGDIYFELKTHDAIYFRLWKVNKLSYSSDSHVYSYRELKHIDYLPPMRWDLFKKGRVVVKVNHHNYEDFYNKCEKEIGRKPHYTCEGTFTVYYSKGTFHTRPYDEKIPYKHKVVNWEDVR